MSPPGGANRRSPVQACTLSMTTQTRFLKSRRGDEGVSMCSFSLQEATPKPLTALMPCYELPRLPGDPSRSGLGNLCGGVARDVSHRPAAVHNPDSSPLMAASRRLQVSSQRHTTTSTSNTKRCGKSSFFFFAPSFFYSSVFSIWIKSAELPANLKSADSSVFTQRL